MSPNVPWTRITGTGCWADRHAKLLAPGGLTPGVCAPAGAATASRPATASSTALLTRSANHTGAGRAQAARGHPLPEREAGRQRGPGADRDRDPLGHRRTVLEAVTRASADDPDAVVQRMARGDEVRVGRQLVAAHAGLAQPPARQPREPL